MGMNLPPNGQFSVCAVFALLRQVPGFTGLMQGTGLAASGITIAS